MRLFKGSAVLAPGTERRFPVRVYVVVAADWQEARAIIGRREPDAHLVTVPVEVPQPLMLGAQSIDAREFVDLRAACAWNETRLRADGEL